MVPLQSLQNLVTDVIRAHGRPLLSCPEVQRPLATIKMQLPHYLSNTTLSKHQYLFDGLHAFQCCLTDAIDHIKGAWSTDGNSVGDEESSEVSPLASYLCSRITVSVDNPYSLLCPRSSRRNLC
jgi:hypothetical protein